MRIRPFGVSDYAAITRLHNQTYSDFAKDVDEFRHRDEHHSEHYRWARWVVLDTADRLVGFAEYHHIYGAFDPHRFGLDMVVDENASGQGFGTRLYDTVMQALAPLEPTAVASWARADMPRLTRFLCKRGFLPNAELFTSGIDLANFDAARWWPRFEALAAQGIEVRSLEALGPTNPRVLRSLYDMWSEVRPDVPLPAGETRSELAGFDEFCEDLHGPGLFPSGYFVAIDGERFVGTSQLFSSPLPGLLKTGLTGVRRAYRRRGIALGLKVRTLGFAQQAGYARVVTDNAADNVGMLAINADLGFARNPVWTRYLKTF